MAFFDLFKKFPSTLLSRDPASFVGRIWLLFSEKMDEVTALQVSMKVLRSIDDAEGKILDLIGDMVGESRDGRDDPEYRLFIKIAIAKNNCSGSIPEIIKIAKVISGDQTFRLNELYETPDERFFDAEGTFNALSTFSPGLRRERAFEVEFEGPIQTLQIPRNLPKAIRQIKAGGVHAKVRGIFDSVMQSGPVGTRTIGASISRSGTSTPSPVRTIIADYMGIPINDSPAFGLMDGQSVWGNTGYFSGITGISPTGILTITEAAV